MKSFIQYLKFFLSGLAFGIANVIPGVSGGTMLVVFGIYDKLTESISGIKAIFKNILFLITFGFGAGGGIVLSALVITKLFAAFGLQTNMYFIGLILGSIPLIYKAGTEKSKVRPLCIVPFLLAMGAVISLSVMERMDLVSVVPDTVSGFNLLFAVKLFLCALLAAVTMIIPGVSGSFIMMLLGVYETVIGAITELNFYVLIPFALGAVIGIIGGAKLISTLIQKYQLWVYSAIMGLVIGSVYAILPDGFGFNTATGAGFVCLLFGVLTAVLVEKLGAAGEAKAE
ncbi:MAG: DUF368 domain-containing protein [Oscillospiraceae bacterium]